MCSWREAFSCWPVGAGAEMKYRQKTPVKLACLQSAVGFFSSENSCFFHIGPNVNSFLALQVIWSLFGEKADVFALTTKQSSFRLRKES